MEILAVPVTGDNIDMPGKASEVHIYKVSNNRTKYDLIKTYKNPSIEMKEDGGLPLLQSLIKEKVNSIILPGIGGPGIHFLDNRIKVYISNGDEIESIQYYLSNKLKFTDEPTVFNCPEPLFKKAEEYRNRL